jgi:hypothetical protein
MALRALAQGLVYSRGQCFRSFLSYAGRSLSRTNMTEERYVSNQEAVESLGLSIERITGLDLSMRMQYSGYGSGIPVSSSKILQPTASASTNRRRFETRLDLTDTNIPAHASKSLCLTHRPRDVLK